MTTDELLEKLPLFIGRTKIISSNGNFIGYTIDNKEGISIGELNLCNEGKLWIASYGTLGNYVCLNPDSNKPPYINAVCYGFTPNEALQNLYDWCIKYKFIEL